MNIDLCDSVYLADGNNNVVLRVNQAPYILRFTKKDPPSLEVDENERGPKESKVISCEDITRFYSSVVRNIVPAIYLISTYQTIQPDSALIAHVMNEFEKSRDTRRAACLIQTDCALIMDDVTRPYEPDPDVFCIEIKPKMGFISGNHITSHIYESKYCRFCLQQISGIKKDFYDVYQQNLYCPLDLFSDCYERIKTAISYLFKFPQNNLKLFKNGILIDFHDWSNYQFLERIFFACIIGDSFRNKSDDNLRNTKLCERSKLPDCCLSGSCKRKGPGGVFNALLKLQTYSDMGQDSIFKIWESYVEPYKKQAVEALSDYDHEIWRDLEKQNIRAPHDQDFSLILLRDFLLSMTFRDASLTFTVKEVKNRNAEIRPPDNAYLLHEGRFYDYSIKMIDTDPKPAKKIPYYYQQSLNIYHAFLKNMHLQQCDQSCRLGPIC